MANIYNFTIKQGTDFSRSFTWQTNLGEPVDVTGKTARLSAKTRYNDTTEVINIDSTGSNLVVGNTNGVIDLSFSDTETRAFNFKYALYDLYVGDYQLLSGSITIDKTVINE